MHAQILRRCGLVLIAVGTVDVAFMIWCIVHRVSYGSSFNFFAVIAGVYLVRGSLKAASAVALFSTFMLASWVAFLLVLPLLYPLGYWIAVLRHHSGMAIAMPVAVALFVLLVWVRKQVLHPTVREARLAAGLSPPKTKLALGVGVAIPLVAVSLGMHMSRGDTAREAMRRAEQQVGGQYQYVLTGLKVSSSSKGRHVSASVAAYNDAELRDVWVSWDE